MNALVQDLDEALKVLFSGKSPLAFVPYAFLQQQELGFLFGVQYFFGDPTKRKILAGNSLVYDHAKFQALADSATIQDSSTDDKWCRLVPLVSEQVQPIGDMFGIIAFENVARLNQSWAFDWSLEPIRRTVGGVRCWLESGDSYDPDGLMRPRERMHDQAVADIVFEGYDGAVFVWPSEWSKFGCLRFHNLDRKPLTILFQGHGTSVKIEALGCKAVRQYGLYSDGLRVGIDTTFQYLWAFRAGDAPIFNATHNVHAGVWGSLGASSIASLPLLHRWLDTYDYAVSQGPGWSFDPRTHYDARALYAGTLGRNASNDCLARYVIHGGNYINLALINGEWQRKESTLSWIGDTLVGEDLTVETSETGIVIRSALAVPHDVLPRTTNALPLALTQLEGANVSVPIPTIGINSDLFTKTDAQVTRRYAIGETLYDVSVTVPSARIGTESLILQAHPFNTHISDVTGLEGNEFDSLNGASVWFDGTELGAYWTRTMQMSIPFLTDNLISPAAWSAGATTYTLHQSQVLVEATNTFCNSARGELLSCIAKGGNNPYEHPFVRPGDRQRGQSFEWDPPSGDEIGLQYHCSVGDQTPMRTAPVWLEGNKFFRAFQSAATAESWAANRSDIIAGATTSEDRKRCWFFRGAREHYNILAARLNAMTHIYPFQFTDVKYWGAPFGGVEVSTTSGFRPPMSAATLENYQTALDRAAELLVTPREYADIATLQNLASLAVPDVEEDLTWLYYALPLIGLPASNDVPQIRYLTFDQLADLAEDFGIYYHAVRLSKPQRLDMDGHPEVPRPAVWHSGESFDFLTDLTHNVYGVSRWEYSTHFGLSTDRRPGRATQDLIDSQMIPGGGSMPFGEESRGLVIERDFYHPSPSSRWQIRDETFLLFHPEPQLRYSSEEIVAVEKPPVAFGKITLNTALQGGTYTFLTPGSIKTTYGLAGLENSADWGPSSMVYVQLVRRHGAFRA